MLSASRTVFALLLVASLGACDRIPSEDVLTEDIRLGAWATADESDRLEVTVHLTTDNPALLEETYLDLGPADTLYAIFDGEEVEMERDFIPVLGLVQYKADFEDVIFGGVLRVRFERDLEESALENAVVIPQPFNMSVANEFSRSEPLSLSWTTTETDDSHVSMRGACMSAIGLFFDNNPGAATFESDRMLEAEKGDLDECMVDVSVEVENDGIVDDAFGRGGFITGSRLSADRILSRP